MNTQSIEEAAAAKLDADRNERIAAVTGLAKAAERLERARIEHAEAEAEHFELFRAAGRHGWTAADLKSFGIEVPSKSVGGRPRKAKTSPTRRAASSPSESQTSDEPSQALRAE